MSILGPASRYKTKRTNGDFRLGKLVTAVRVRVSGTSVSLLPKRDLVPSHFFPNKRTVSFDMTFEWRGPGPPVRGVNPSIAFRQQFFPFLCLLWFHYFLLLQVTIVYIGCKKIPNHRNISEIKRKVVKNFCLKCIINTDLRGTKLNLFALPFL